MSDVDGIYNKPPWEDGARLMNTYTSKDKELIEFGKKSKVRIHCLQKIQLDCSVLFFSMKPNEQCVRYVYNTDKKFLRTFFPLFSVLVILPYNKNK